MIRHSHQEIFNKDVKIGCAEDEHSLNVCGTSFVNGVPVFDYVSHSAPCKYFGHKNEAYDLPSYFTQTTRNMAFDGRYMYLASFWSNLVRWDPSDPLGTMRDIGWDSSFPTQLEGFRFKELVFDGNRTLWATAHTYAGSTNHNPYLAKFDIHLEKWTHYYETGNDYQVDGLTMDGDGNLWIGNCWTYSNFWKFDVNAEDFTIFTVSGGYKIRNLCFDGTNVWGGAFEPDNVIIKIDPSDGSQTVVNFDSGDNGSEHVVFDGTWIWTVHDTDPTRVSKINPEDNTHVTYTLASGNNSPRSLLYDGKSIWIGQKPYDHFLVKMDPQSGEYITYNSGNTDYKWVYSLGYDGKHLWAGMTGDTKRIMRWIRTS